MSQSEKAAYFRALKDAGVEFERHYREYTTEELKEAYAPLAAANGWDATPRVEQPEQPELDLGLGEPLPVAGDDPDLDAAAQSFFGLQRPTVPQRAADPNEMAGQRLNTKAEDEPIRIDELGREWFQEEIRKPSYPKPRGRRVLTYTDSGVSQETVKNGDFIESFEVAGTGRGRTAEVKITLPSYQVGTYKDRRFPFKVHTYNGLEGFDLFEVADFYGGRELVPAEVKRVYVENVLCYDIRTTVRAINDEYRQLQLTGKVE